MSWSVGLAVSQNSSVFIIHSGCIQRSEIDITIVICNQQFELMSFNNDIVVSVESGHVSEADCQLFCLKEVIIDIVCLIERIVVPGIGFKLNDCQGFSKSSSGKCT